MAVEDEEERLYWEERRRFEEDYMDWCRRGNLGPFPRGRPAFPGGAMPPVCLLAIPDDDYLVAKADCGVNSPPII